MTVSTERARVTAVMPDTWLVQLPGDMKDTAVHRYQRVRYLADPNTPGADATDVAVWWKCIRHEDRARNAGPCEHIKAVKESLP